MDVHRVRIARVNLDELDECVREALARCRSREGARGGGACSRAGYLKLSYAWPK